MPDLPDIFNRVDFIGILSPGYVATLLWIAIFHYNYLTGNEILSSEILSSVIFVVAGPAVGLTLRRMNHAIISIIEDLIWPLYYRILMKRHKEKAKKWLDEHKKKHEEYAKVRLGLDKDKRLELDMPAAYTDFEASLGISFVGFALIGMNEFNTFLHIEFLVPPSWCFWSSKFGLLFLIGIFFIFGAYLNHHYYYKPIYQKLKDEALKGDLFDFDLD